MKEFIIASALVLLIGGGLYYASKKGKKTTLDVSSIDEETLDGELKLSDVVDFFKNKGLNKEVDIPCLIHPQSSKVSKLHITPSSKLQKDGYTTIIVAVYNKTKDCITDAQIIHAKSFGMKLNEMLQTTQSDIIVLS